MLVSGALLGTMGSAQHWYIRLCFLRKAVLGHKHLSLQIVLIKSPLLKHRTGHEGLRVSGQTSLYKMSGLVLCKMRVKATSCCPPGCFWAALYVAYLQT